MSKSKKAIQRKSPTGNDIQIQFERYMSGGYIAPGLIRLKVVALEFQSVTNYKWAGNSEHGFLTVEYDKKSGDNLYSDNFPDEHKNAAVDEVRRIIRQFN